MKPDGKSMQKFHSCLAGGIVTQFYDARLYPLNRDVPDALRNIALNSIAGMARSYIYVDKGQVRWFSLGQV
jgi:hypothetical protein